MSEALYFDKYGRPTRSSRRCARDGRLNRLLLLLVVGLSLFLVGELIFHLIVAPRLMVRSVVIRSDLPLSKEEILGLAGFEDTIYYYQIDPVAVAERLEAVPVVRSATVQRSFPDQLTITLHRRVPLSLLFYTAESGRSVPLLIDEQGVVFEIGRSLSQWDLPVITGVRFEQLEIGARLPEMIQPLLQDLRRLQRQEPGLFRLISELRLIPKPSGAIEVLLYPIHYPVALRLAGGLDGATLRTAAVVLDLLATRQVPLDVRELDLRSGEVVYRMASAGEEGSVGF